MQSLFQLETLTMSSTAWKPRVQSEPELQKAQVPEGMDPALYQRYMEFLHHASAAQFKPCKLYVVFTDPTSVNCAEMVRNNIDLGEKYLISIHHHYTF